MLLIEPDFDSHQQTDNCYGCIFKGKPKRHCPKDKNGFGLLCAADYEINIWVKGPVSNYYCIRYDEFAEPEELL